MLRVGDTLVPLIFMSDGTHLLNVSGVKTEWPLCGNWQSIFEDLPNALNAQRRNGHSPTGSNQDAQYFSEAAR